MKELSLSDLLRRDADALDASGDDPQIRFGPHSIASRLREAAVRLEELSKSGIAYSERRTADAFRISELERRLVATQGWLEDFQSKTAELLLELARKK